MLFFTFLLTFWLASGISEVKADDPTPTPTPTDEPLFQPPTEKPTLDFNCYGIQPAGMYTLTPDPSWLGACSHCITKTPVLWPTINPTLSAMLTGTPMPTSTPQPTATPAGVAGSVYVTSNGNVSPTSWTSYNIGEHQVFSHSAYNLEWYVQDVVELKMNTASSLVCPTCSYEFYYEYTLTGVAHSPWLHLYGTNNTTQTTEIWRLNSTGGIISYTKYIGGFEHTIPVTSGVKGYLRVKMTNVDNYYSWDYRWVAQSGDNPTYSNTGGWSMSLDMWRGAYKLAPTPTPAPQTYCSVVKPKTTQEVFDPYTNDYFRLPGITVGWSRCIQFGGFTIPLDWINTILTGVGGDQVLGDLTIPGIQFCFKPIKFGEIRILGYGISLDFMASIMAGVLLFRLIMRS